MNWGLEGVLELSQGSKGLGWAMSGCTSKSTDAGLYRVRVAAQKGITSQFVGEADWEGWLVGSSPFLRGGLPGNQVRIVRVDLECETQVGKGVFMRTADQCVAGQGGQPLQAGMQHRRGAFENLAAATGKQRITAEKPAMAKISQVAEGVAGDFQDLELKSHRLDRARRAFAKWMIDAADSVAGWSIDGKRVVPQKFLDATTMVAVMMGEEHGHGRDGLPVQPFKYRLRLPRIDQDRPRAIVDGPDIVIVEREDGFWM